MFIFVEGEAVEDLPSNDNPTSTYSGAGNMGTENKGLDDSKDQGIKKVIVSHLGELTKDTRTVGDTIRYRIYYSGIQEDGTKSSGGIKISDPIDIAITDQLDKGLSNINVLNEGKYDQSTHTITWIVKNVSEKTPKPFVEFEAQIVSCDHISNKAIINSIEPLPNEPKFIGETNTVEITVIPAPKMGWIPFEKDDKLGVMPRVYMKDESTMAITVRFDIPGVFAYEERVGGVAYQHLSIPGRAPLTDIGKPELPIAGEIIEVPFDVDFTPEITKSESVTLEGYNIYPAQEEKIDDANSPQNIVVDKKTYLSDENYPLELAEAAKDDIANIRGHRIMFLKVKPIQYNPVTRTVTAYTMIEVRLRYSKAAQIERVNKRVQSSAFELLLEASVLNYKRLNRFYEPEYYLARTKLNIDNDDSTGCDYLIITHDAFYDEKDPSNPILKLANWKRKKGYQTKVVKVGSISGGNTAASIKSYIQQAYDKWYPVPSYILLVGDSDLISAHDGLDHVNSNQPKILTDLYYVTVDGSDYFPDIYIGRLPVDTTQEVADVVDKILTYEQNPPSTPLHADFYNHISLLGLFTDDDDGWSTIDGKEGRPWIANLEAIRQFLLGQNYLVDRIYTVEQNVWFSGPPSQGPQRFNDGTPLPNDLIFPNYGWNGGAADITNAINNGRFLLNYRAHGGWNGWGNLSYGISEVSNLNQPLNPPYLTPVIFSVTCQTCWFDNEIDDDTHGGRPAGDECFAEVLLRRPKSGAVAMIGHTRDSWTGHNDFIIFGLFRAIWPAFTPNPAWSGHPTVPPASLISLRRMGQILNFARMFMAQAYTPMNKDEEDRRKREFEMCHLLGDPEMPIWIQAPGDLSVNHPKGIGASGVQDFVVLVTDKATGQAISDAVVVLTRNNTILGKTETRTDGLARFVFNSIGAGNLDITITALNYRPYMGSIDVKSGSAVLNRLDPSDGSEGQTINVGGEGFQANENVQIRFGDQPPITATTDANGNFGQGTPTVDINVPMGYAHGLVNIVAHGQTSDLYAVRVFQVRDINPVDLWTYDQFDSTTWNLNPGDNPTWDSPDIQLYDSNGNPVASNNLIFGETYKVQVKIRNKSSFNASNAKVVFYWENYGAGGPWQQFDVKNVDVPMNPPGLQTAETTFQPQATGHICIKAVVEHPEDTTPDNNEGQENLHVGYSSSPTDVCFSIWNLTTEPAPVYLEVRQMIDPSKDRKQQRLWASSIRHPDNQVLQPGERAEACVTVDPDEADAKEGTQAEFAVTAFIGKKMIGGINLVMAKKTSDIQPWSEQVCKALALLNAVLLAALIVALGAINNVVGLAVAVLLVVAASIWNIRCHPKICRIIRTFLAGAGLGALVLIILALLGTSSSQLIAVLAAAVVLIIILIVIGAVRKCF